MYPERNKNNFSSTQWCQTQNRTLLTASSIEELPSMHSSGQTRGTARLCDCTRGWLLHRPSPAPGGGLEIPKVLNPKQPHLTGLILVIPCFASSGTAVCSNWESFLGQSLNVSILRVPNLGGFLWAHSSHTHTYTHRESRVYGNMVGFVLKVG